MKGERVQQLVGSKEKIRQTKRQPDDKAAEKEEEQLKVQRKPTYEKPNLNKERVESKHDKVRGEVE